MGILRLWGAPTRLCVMEKRPLEKGVEDTGLRVEVEKWPVTQICGCGVNARSRA